MGLYYFGKRYYDPELLRWLTLDPAEAGENLYAYVHNNPFKYLDPDGQFAFLIAIPLIGAEAGAAAALAWSAAATAVAWGGYELSKILNKRIDEYQARRELEQQNDQTSTIDTEEEKKKKSCDVYVPDRNLPRDKYGNPIPDVDAPHSQLGTKEGREEKYPQIREFDKYGKPVRDIDFTDHRYPEKHPDPHQHKYVENKTGGTLKREKAELVPEWKYE